MLVMLGSDTLRLEIEGQRKRQRTGRWMSHNPAEKERTAVVAYQLLAPAPSGPMIEGEIEHHAEQDKP